MKITPNFDQNIKNPIPVFTTIIFLLFSPALQAANPGDIIITEVMAAATSDQDQCEFIEIYNTTCSTIDVAGWYIGDAGDANDTITSWNAGNDGGTVTDPDPILNSTKIPPGSYAVYIDPEYANGSECYDLPPESILLTTDGDSTVGDGLSEADTATVFLEDESNNIIDSNWINCGDISQGNDNSVQCIRYDERDSADDFIEPGGSTPGAQNSGYISGEIVCSSGETLTNHMALEKTDVSGDLNAGDVNEEVLTFRIINPTNSHNLVSIEVSNSALIPFTPFQLDAVEFWVDKNRDNTWDASDTKIDNLYYSASASAWTNSSLSVSETNYFLITIDVNVSAPEGSGFRAKIISGGLTCSAGYTNVNEIENSSTRSIPFAALCDSANHVVFSEVYYRDFGAGGVADFIELYNPNQFDICLDNWRIYHVGNDGSPQWWVELFGTIRSHGYFLIQTDAGTGVESEFGITPDMVAGVGNLQVTADGVKLLNTHLDIIDTFGWGSGGSDYYEGSPDSAIGSGSEGQSHERKSTSAHVTNEGNAYDTQNNANDFQTITAQPQNSSSVIEAPPCMDLIPPSAISDLRATNTIWEGQIALSWTSPGDDGDTGEVERYYIRYSTNPITNETSFLFGTYYNTSTWLDIQPSGSVENRVLTGLIPEQLYYIGIKAVDPAGNYSSLSYISPNSTSDSVDSAIPFQDTITPGTVTNLSVTNGGPSELKLIFTAPGDDDYSGQALSYEIRYSTSPITTDTEFSNATVYPQSFIPKVAGSSEILILNGLIGDQLYYVAIKAIDNLGHTSPFTAAGMVDSGRAGETVPPTILSAKATNIDGLYGIGDGDQVIIRWSESMNGAPIHDMNVDTVLWLGSHSWLCGANTISTAYWSSNSFINDTLTIVLETNVSLPTVAAGDTFRVSGGYLTDLIGNAVDCTATITGTFGDDVTPPTFVSAVAYDSSGLGAGIQKGDTIVIRFSEAMNPAVITESTIDTYLELNNGGKSWGDISSSAEWSSTTFLNDTLTIILTNGVLVSVGDYIKCPSADTIEDMYLNDIPVTNTVTIIGSLGGDNEPPLMVSAVADDNSAGGTGIQAGDRVVITFNEAMNAFAVTSGNIDGTLLINNGSGTWLDNSSGFFSAAWQSSIFENDTLIITLSDTSGLPGNILTPGDMISIATNTLKDSAGNDSGGNTLAGSFGSSGPAGDGSGTVQADPAALDINGTNTVDIRFTGNGTFTLFSNTLLITSNWTWTGNISDLTLSGSGYASAGIREITPIGKSWRITITNARITDMDTGTVQIGNLAAPPSPQTVYFPCSTAVSNGTMTSVSSFPYIILSIPADWYEFYFNYSPYNDPLDTVLVSKIDQAWESIRMTMYNCGEADIINALKAAADRGVDIDIICEKDNRDNFSSLEGYGSTPIEVRDDGTAGYPLMHNKFIVFDHNYSGSSVVKNMVWTGSYNITWSGTTHDAQDIIVIKNSTALAQDFIEEFNEMWGGTYSTSKADTADHFYSLGGGVNNVEAWFSPSDDVNSIIRSRMATADHNIYFCIFTFTVDELANEMIDKWNTGVKVAGVMDSGQSSLESAEYLNLLNNGVPVKKSFDCSLLHHKYMIIDYGHPDSDPMLIVGSHNWTASANNQNDENILIIHDPNVVSKFYQEFLARYGGNPFGVAASASIQPGSAVRNSLDNTVSIDISHDGTVSDTYTTVQIKVPNNWPSLIDDNNVTAVRDDGYDYIANGHVTYIPQVDGTLINISDAGITPSGASSSMEVILYNMAAPPSTGKSYFEISLGTPSDSPTGIAPSPYIIIKSSAIVINEVTFNSGGGGIPKDWIELYCMDDGNQGKGLNLNNYFFSVWDPAGSSIKTVSDCTLKNGEYLVLHLGDDGLGLDDTSAGTDRVIHLYSTYGGLTASDEQAVFYDSSGVVLDAVCWANNDLNWSTGEDTDVEELNMENEWILDAGTPAEESDCANGSLSGSGESLCRNALSLDTDHKSDWSFDSTPTPGEINSATSGEGSYHDMVINEIMYQPSTPESGREWFEIYNTRDYDIDLATWDIAIINNSGTTDHYNPPVVIAAGGYLVFADKITNGTSTDSLENDFGNADGSWGTDSAYESYQPILHDGLENSITLAGTGYTILIHDGAGKVIDSVSFDSSWGGQPLSGTTNVSLERKDPLGASDDPANWASCASRWTPYKAHRGSHGSRNSLAGGNDDAIVISEIYFDDSDLPDRDEWIELYNSDSVATVNIKGWVLTDFDGQSFTFGDIAIPPQSYLVLHTGAGTDETDWSDKKADLFTGEALRDMLESQDELGLYRSSVKNFHTIVDFVAWSASGNIINSSADDDAVTAGKWQTNKACVVDLGSWSMGQSLYLTNEAVNTNGLTDYRQVNDAMEFLYSEGYPNLNNWSNNQPLVTSASCYMTSSDPSGQTARVGDFLYFRVDGTDQDGANLNTTTVKVTSDLSDKINGIVITLKETLPNSGSFTGSCRVYNTSDDAAGYIQAASGEYVTLAWTLDRTNFYDTVLIAGTSEEDIKINEFLPNISKASDNNAVQYEEEWIELYNSGNIPHNITGWTLKMRGQGGANNLTTYVIPQVNSSDVTLDPYGYAVIHFADSTGPADDYKTGTVYHLHAFADDNYMMIDSSKPNLDQFGGSIGLYTLQGAIVDYLAYSQDQNGFPVYQDALLAGIWSAGDYIKTGRYDGPSRNVLNDNYLHSTVYARRSDGEDSNSSEDWHWTIPKWGYYSSTPGRENFPFADRGGLTAPPDVDVTLVEDRPLDAGGAVNLQWNPVPDADMKGYLIFYSTIPFTDCRDAEVYFRSPVNAGGSTKSWTVLGLYDNYSYYFAVVGIDKNNNFDIFSRSSTVPVSPVRDLTNDIIVNEINFDPQGGTDYEFIELYNRGTNIVDLDGWYYVYYAPTELSVHYFYSDDLDGHAWGNDVILNGNSYGCIMSANSLVDTGPQQDDLPLPSEDVNKIYIKASTDATVDSWTTDLGDGGLYNVGNAGDQRVMEVYDNYGNMVDSVTWYYRGPGSSHGGYGSMSRTDLNLSSFDSKAWQESTHEDGTPLQPNVTNEQPVAVLRKINNQPPTLKWYKDIMHFETYGYDPDDTGGNGGLVDQCEWEFSANWDGVSGDWRTIEPYTNYGTDKDNPNTTTGSNYGLYWNSTPTNGTVPSGWIRTRVMDDKFRYSEWVYQEIRIDNEAPVALSVSNDNVDVFFSGDCMVTIHVSDNNGSGLSGVPQLDYFIVNYTGMTTYNDGVYEDMVHTGDDRYVYGIGNPGWNLYARGRIYYRINTRDLVGNSTSTSNFSEYIEMGPDHVKADYSDGVASPFGTELIFLQIVDQDDIPVPGRYYIRVSVDMNAKITATSLTSNSGLGSQTVYGYTATDGTATVTVYDETIEYVIIGPHSDDLPGSIAPVDRDTPTGVFFQPGRLKHFYIIHDSVAVKDIDEPITINAVDEYYNTKTDYIGTITIWAEQDNPGSEILWSLVSAYGTLNDGGAGQDWATFTYAVSNYGSVLLYFNDDSADTLDIDCRDSNQTQFTDYERSTNQGLLEVIELTPPSQIFSVEIFKDPNYTISLTNAAGGNVLYIRLIGLDSSPNTIDNTAVYVTSSVSDPAGIVVFLTESDFDSGTFLGSAVLRDTSDTANRWINAQVAGESVEVCSVVSNEINDRVLVINTPPVAINKVTYYQSDYTSDLPVVSLFANAYLEVQADPGSPYTRDLTTVRLTSSAYPAGFTMQVTESGPDTGRYRNYFKLDMTTDSNSMPQWIACNTAGDSVLAVSLVNTSMTDRVHVTNTPIPPADISNISFMSYYDSSVTNAYLSGEAVRGGVRLWVKVTAGPVHDGNPFFKDNTLVRVSSSLSDPSGIWFRCYETGDNTGIYTNSFRLENLSVSASRHLGASLPEEILTVTSDSNIRYRTDTALLANTPLGQIDDLDDGTEPNEADGKASAVNGASVSYISTPPDFTTIVSNGYSLQVDFSANSEGVRIPLSLIDTTDYADWTFARRGSATGTDITVEFFDRKENSDSVNFNNIGTAWSTSTVNLAGLSGIELEHIRYVHITGSSGSGSFWLDDMRFTNPDPVSSVTIYSSGYSAGLTNASLGEQIFIELSGTVLNTNTVDNTIVVLKSDTDVSNGIRIILTETARDSGIYRGYALLDSVTIDSAGQIGAQVGDLVYVVSASAPSVLDTVLIVPGPINQFDIIHDGYGETGTPEGVRVYARDDGGGTKTDFTGTVTIDLATPSSGTVFWLTNGTGLQGTVISLSGSTLVYSFASADQGVISLQINDDSTDSLDIECSDGLGHFDSDIAPRNLVFISGGKSDLRITRKVTSIELNGKSSGLIPGASLNIKISYTNASLVQANESAVFDLISQNVTWATNSQSGTATGWTISWSTNPVAELTYHSPDFTQTCPAAQKIRWVRWNKPVVAGKEGGSVTYLEYRVIIR